jgi:hypothetical protein
MRATGRLRLGALVLAISVCAAIGTSSAGAAGLAHSAGTPSVKRFSLSGYVLDAKYTRGRNTGNTFQQTYKVKTVHGVPVQGPYVGTKYPVEDYVAMSIGHHELYVAWLDAKTHALLDVFVMNLRTHRIWDYAPGSLHPESTGTVSVVKVPTQKAH